MPLLKPPRWSVNSADIEPRYRDLWRDVVFVLNPSVSIGDEIDLFAKHVTWPVGGVVSEPTQWGQGWRANTAGSVTGVSLPLDIDSCSVMVVADWDNNGVGGQSCLVKRSDVVASRSFVLNHSPAGLIVLATNVESSSSATSVGTVDGPVVVVVTNDGTDASAGAKFYFDGVLDSSTAGVTGNDNTSTWVFGQLAADSTNALFDGRLVLAVLWDRVLSPAEVTLLQLDPFGMLRPALLETETALDNIIATDMRAVSVVTTSLTVGAVTTPITTDVRAASVATGSVTQIHDLTATSNSASVVAATLNVTHRLTADTRAISTVTADVTQTNELATTVASASVTTITVTQTHELTTDTRAVSTTTVTLAVVGEVTRAVIVIGDVVNTIITLGDTATIIATTNS